MNPVIYEVTLRVQADVADAYARWLGDHIAQMLALPGFLGAQAGRQLEPSPAGDEVVFTCSYRLEHAAALQAYLTEHAPRMRADGEARFGGRFSASRRVLQALPGY